MTAAQAAESLESHFASQVSKRVSFRDEETVVVDSGSLEAILRYCRDELAFDYLVDVSSLDHMGQEPRFEMVYELYSYATKAHLRIRCAVPEDTLTVPSAIAIWPTADWHEREVYDMMGITFEGHPDLRRILMWEGFEYYPLRKDFPLAGKSTEVPDVAFTAPAPLAGGPFVTEPTEEGVLHREPRSRS